jgi:hypothetical protein
MITVMNMEEEFPVIFTIWDSQGIFNPVWQNYCNTVPDSSLSNESGVEWVKLVNSKLMAEHSGIIDYANDIRFKTEADLTLFLLRFS